jgi:hypothetical protein
MEHEHGPLRHRDVIERAADHVIVPGAKVPRLRGRIETLAATGHCRNGDFANPSSTAAAGRRAARVDQDSSEPLVEAIGIAEAGQVAPDPHERVLRGVARIRLVSQDRHRDPERRCQACVDEGFERVAIASTSAVGQQGLAGACVRSHCDGNHHLGSLLGLPHMSMTPAATRWLIRPWISFEGEVSFVRMTGDNRRTSADAHPDLERDDRHR